MLLGIEVVCGLFVINNLVCVYNSMHGEDDMIKVGFKKEFLTERHIPRYMTSKWGFMCSYDCTKWNVWRCE